MKANVSYDDYVGTAAADISDFLAKEYGDSIDSIGKYFRLDSDRFKVIGITIQGTGNLFVSLLCIDRQKSTAEKEYITKISLDVTDDHEILKTLFKSMQIVLYQKNDKKYPALHFDEEAEFDEYHR